MFIWNVVKLEVDDRISRGVGHHALRKPSD